jgi:hypothetical protein
MYSRQQTRQIQGANVFATENSSDLGRECIRDRKLVRFRARMYSRQKTRQIQGANVFATENSSDLGRECIRDRKFVRFGARTHSRQVQALYMPFSPSFRLFFTSSTRVCRRIDSLCSNSQNSFTNVSSSPCTWPVAIRDFKISSQRSS